MTTKREYERRTMMNDTLRNLGFTSDECDSLRRISMALHSWHERECGTDNGCIERDEQTSKPYWLDSHSMKRYPIRDMEAGAMKRLAVIMAQHDGNHCHRCEPDALQPCGQSCGHVVGKLSAYIRTDPRGAALYILRPGDVPAGELLEAYYSRGICVY